VRRQRLREAALIAGRAVAVFPSTFEIAASTWNRGLIVRLSNMAVRTNSQMLRLLGGDPEFHEPNNEPVPESLVEELRQGFKQVDGCVVPCSFQATSIWSETHPRVNDLDDETGFECSLSKVHLDAFVDEGVPLSELARIGCAYAMYLRQALLRSQVSGAFEIIVDAQLPDAELQVGNVCSVRFHKIRPGQGWLVGDLETYERNAIWVFEFEKPAVPSTAPALRP
jgi:hypothetical protein